MSNSPRGILVFSELEETRLELLSKAHAIAASLGVPVNVVLLGQDVLAGASGLARWGADRVYVVEDPTLGRFNVECYLDALVSVIEVTKPELVLLGASKSSYELGPRLAARLGAGCVSVCIDFSVAPETHSVEARAMLYSGLGIATYRVTTLPAVILMAPHTTTRCDLGVREAEVVVLPAPKGQPRLQVLEVRSKPSATAHLEAASAVVDVGQGVRQQDDLAMVAALAEALGAQMCCTRPVSSERGWFPEWLGLSGKQISPRLCITVGVSGAIQHLIGIRGSEAIVAVDNSPDSPMLFQADYGVVDDLYQFVPALIEVLKARGVHVARKK